MKDYSHIEHLENRVYLLCQDLRIEVGEKIKSQIDEGHYESVVKLAKMRDRLDDVMHDYEHDDVR